MGSRSVEPRVGEGGDQLGDNLIGGLGSSVNLERGHVPQEWLTKMLQSRSLLGTRLTTMVISGQSDGENRPGGSQPDGGVLGEGSPAGLVVDHTRGGGNHAACWALSQLEEEFKLKIVESRDPITPRDRRSVFPGPLGEDSIGVEEWNAELDSEQGADGGLTHPHRPDQHDVTAGARQRDLLDM
jgi:hypothetical protein